MGVTGVTPAVLGVLKLPFRARFNDSGPFCGWSLQLPNPSSSVYAEEIFPPLFSFGLLFRRRRIFAYIDEIKRSLCKYYSFEVYT